ncbi:MAG: hypothetical protein Q7T55_11965 [Solirubrobacteraceae bacterium]|nr:hypothetical protein [Solirubrobacteraceae bacterium]
MTSGERDLPLLMWFAVAALLCLSTVVLPMLAPDLEAASATVRSIGAQLGAATTGVQPSVIVQGFVALTILTAEHAQRVQRRF